VRSNPDISAARAAVEAARGRLVQAGLWENPELTLAGRSDFAFRNEGERNVGVDIAQRFPVAGRLARQRDVARVDVAIALAEVRDAERTLIGEAQQAVYALLSLDAALASRDKVLRIAGELARTASRRLEAAEVSEADVNLLEIERARFEQEQRLLQLERGAAAVRLNRLLNRPTDDPVEITGAIEKPAFATMADRVATAAQRRPDLQRLRLESDRASAEARLARAETWEDWTIGAGFESERLVFRGEPASDPIGVKKDEFLGLSLSVPLPLWNRNQGRIGEARASERRAEALLASALRRAEAEVETAALRTQELTRVAHEYEASILPRSRRTVELLERGYAQGLVPITTLVQAEQQLAEAELARARTLGELRSAEVELETATAASPLLDGIHGEEQP
jgi:cobalt-zinc-cadmium efflux system outer membrane protein